MSYDNETPMNDKFLMADGSVRNSNGQTIQSASEYWKQVYDQATPIPAKFLHADGTIDENIGGGGSGTSLKYHLYAWDYGSGFCVGYTEKEVPVAGDLLFLKQDMEEGKITDPTELKMIYHVVSDADGVITVSEHPEGQSGYTFTRNPDDDYEETITDVRDCVDVTENGLLTSQKGTAFKSANIKIEGDEKIIIDIGVEFGSTYNRYYEINPDGTQGRGIYFKQYNYNHSNGKILIKKIYNGVEVYGGSDDYYTDDFNNYSKYRIREDYNVGDLLETVLELDVLDNSNYRLVPSPIVYRIAKIF